MKLKKQCKVLEKSALCIFGYGGSAKRVKKLYKSVYKRLPARTVSRILAESEQLHKFNRGVQKTLAYHSRYGRGLTEVYGEDTLGQLLGAGMGITLDELREAH